jgi:hypothetical protein
MNAKYIVKTNRVISYKGIEAPVDPKLTHINISVFCKLTGAHRSYIWRKLKAGGDIKEHKLRVSTPTFTYYVTIKQLSK